jgi:type II secretory pathway component PulM
MNWLRHLSLKQTSSRDDRWDTWLRAISWQTLETLPWKKPLVATFFLFVIGIGVFWLGRGSLQQLQDQLAMRPIQWSALGQLIAQVRTPIASSRIVATLDEAELNAIRNLLVQQGLKPVAFQLTADNPPHIHLQVNGVLFASLIDFLEDLRKTRNIYPVRANVQATPALGVVNASLTLEQMK